MRRANSQTHNRLSYRATFPYLNQKLFFTFLNVCFVCFQQSSGSSTSGGSKKDKAGMKSGGSGSDTDVSVRRVGAPSAPGAPGAPPMSNLTSVPHDVSGSRQSFRMAMGNPCELFFVDVM